jgi:hypothetical protein
MSDEVKLDVDAIVPIMAGALYEDVLATADTFDPPPPANLFIGADLTPQYFTLCDKGNTVVVITFDPPGVEVNPDYDWNTAAKCFWNAVCRVSGRPALFPDAG